MKNIKRLLCLALAFVLTITALIVPAFARDPETNPYSVEIADDNMSQIKYLPYGTYGNPDNFTEYSSGQYWVPLYQADNNIENRSGSGMVFSTGNMAKDASSQIYRKSFVNKTVYPNSDLKLEYKIKTFSRTTDGAGYRIWAVIDGMSGPQLFSYAAHTGVLQFAGTTGWSWSGSGNVTLSEDTDYTITIELVRDVENLHYDLKYSVVKDEDSTRVASATVDNYSRVTDCTAFGRIGFILQATGAQSDDKDVFLVKNIKIDNVVRYNIITFGDELSLNDTRTAFDDTMVNAADEIVSVNDNSFINGTSWCLVDEDGNDKENNGCFYANNGYLQVKSPAHTEDTWNRYMLKKKFSPITSGSILTATMTLKYNPCLYWNRGYSIRLGNTDGQNLSIFRTRHSGANYLCALGIDSGWGAGADTGDEQEITGFADNTDINITMVISPKDDDNYNVSLTLAQTGAESLVLNRTITKAMAESFDRLEVWAATMKAGTLLENIAVKNAKIDVSSGTKEALTAGENNIYLSCTNVTGYPVDYALVAAVCNKTTNEQTGVYAIAEYTDNMTYTQNLMATVNVSDPETETVKLFVFDNFDNITPWIKPLIVE